MLQTVEAKRSNHSRARSAPRKLGAKQLSNAIDVRIRQASQPRTKGGYAISANYQGRMQSNASRLPGSWSDSYHHKPLSMRLSDRYFTDLVAIPKRIPIEQVKAGKATLSWQEFSERKGYVITKRKNYEIAREREAWELEAGLIAPSDMRMRGEPCLFDDCVSFETSLYQPAMRCWNYKWSDEPTLRYVGKEWLTGHSVYALGSHVRTGLLSRLGVPSRVQYHKPQPLPAIGNAALVRSIRQPIPYLDAMLETWQAHKAQQHIAALGYWTSLGLID